MQLRFWACVLLLVGGAATLGYASGRYHGLKEAQLNAHTILRDFVRSTDMESYLHQRGQPEWLGRLNAYGLVGSDSYLRVRQKRTTVMLLGLLCVAVGLVGLRFAAGSVNEMRNEKQTD